MTLINGDKIITTQLYDDEYEEWAEEKMSIIDYVNAYTDEGVTTADDVLDKLRAEIEQKFDTHGKVSLYNRAIHDVLEIIDKYKEEN
jgi:hypothetical protein